MTATCWLCGRDGPLTATLTEGGQPAHGRCVTQARKRLREITDAWNPLSEAQKNRLSLLLHPGRGRHDVA
jgi:hypothetical protein